MSNSDKSIYHTNESKEEENKSFPHVPGSENNTKKDQEINESKYK